MRYICCIYVLVSLVSMGLLFNQNAMFHWLEMARCLAFLCYSLYRPFQTESILVNLLLYSIRLFYFYSAWMCRQECVKVFSIASAEQKTK